MADINPPTTYTPEIIGKDWEGHGSREVEEALRRLREYCDYLKVRMDEADAAAAIAATTAGLGPHAPSGIFALMV